MKSIDEKGIVTRDEEEHTLRKVLQEQIFWSQWRCDSEPLALL
jgi:hypothetical protein